MSVVTEHSTLLGASTHLNVTRALSELQAQRPVRLLAPSGDYIAVPIEGLDDGRLSEFRCLCNGSPKLVITPQRARAIGIHATTPMALPIPSDAKARRLFALATDSQSQSIAAYPAEPAATAAIRLIKLSGGVPAALAGRIADDRSDVM